MKNIFIIGSKGIPSNYGGFETFVDKLTEYKISPKIKYHIACAADHDGEFEYNGARCFNISTPNIGSAKAVAYDVKALKKVYEYIKTNKIKGAIVYILACRIGPFMSFYKKKLAKLGVTVLLNPDGHEWKRKKWNFVIRKYWKFSEKLMVKNTDLAICDSQAIQDYIKREYQVYNPSTTFIAYGATVNMQKNLKEEKYKDWLNEWNLKEKEYYLVVGRFVPENNYELMIKEFMNSDTLKPLVIVTNIQKNKFYKDLNKKTCFMEDPRIKFVGTIYDQELLYQVRRDAYGYIHGHEVGGTNPSLLEALATTPLNLLLDVEFNREVGREAALYFDKYDYSMSNIINRADKLTKDELNIKEIEAKRIIKNDYAWHKIVKKYEETFLGL